MPLQEISAISILPLTLDRPQQPIAPQIFELSRSVATVGSAL